MNNTLELFASFVILFVAGLIVYWAASKNISWPSGEVQIAAGICDNLGGEMKGCEHNMYCALPNGTDWTWNHTAHVYYPTGGHSNG
jgi:hypothetical protein